MKNVKSFWKLSVAFFFLFLIIFSFQSAVYAKTVLKMGHIFPETMPVAKAAALFAKEVNSRTNGSIELKIYPASQLGKVKELYGQPWNHALMRVMLYTSHMAFLLLIRNKPVLFLLKM